MLINPLGQRVFLSSSKMSAGQNTFELPLDSLERGFLCFNTIIGDRYYKKIEYYQVIFFVNFGMLFD